MPFGPGSPLSPVRFADEILRNTGIFAYFVAKSGAVSLRLRLAGGEIEIRTFVTFCPEPLRADVRATCNGFCNIYVSSGEFASALESGKTVPFLIPPMANA
jgi:hypothetical protein